MNKILFIGGFGLIGIFSRYFLGQWVSRFVSSPFPYATFFINILGSFLIGLLYVWGTERGGMSNDLRLGLMVGLLGGFTTFSAFSLELTQLLERSEYALAGIYFVLSPTLGLLGAIAGLHVARLCLKAA